MSLHHIQKISVTDQILFQLEREILLGSWKAGEQIPSEISIARALHVSRTSVTGALDILRKRKVLVTTPGIGTFVSPDPFSLTLQISGIIPPDDASFLLEIVEFLQVILVPATQLAVEKMTPSFLSHTQRLLSQMLSNLQLPDSFSRLESRFYQEILQATQNALLIQIFESNESLLLLTLQQLDQLADLHKSSAQYTRLIEAFENADPIRARILMDQKCHYFSALLTEVFYD